MDCSGSVASLFGTKLYEMLEGTVAHWATSNRAAWVLSALVEGKGLLLLDMLLGLNRLLFSLI